MDAGEGGGGAAGGWVVDRIAGAPARQRWPFERGSPAFPLGRPPATSFIGRTSQGGERSAWAGRSQHAHPLQLAL
eukprot:scaffold17266_cov82-Isochrysis_galbana.AAC.2